MNSPKGCDVDNCPRPAAARGWCKRHYLQWFRTGDPVSRNTDPLEDNTPPAVTLSVSVPPEMAARLRSIADKRGISLAELMRRIVRQTLSRGM